MMAKTNKGFLHLKFTSNAPVGAPPAAQADNGPSPCLENVRAVGGGGGGGTAGAETPDYDALDAEPWQLMRLPSSSPCYQKAAHDAAHLCVRKA